MLHYDGSQTLSLIPGRFHFVYGLREQPEPLHLVFYLCLESCRRLHPGSEIFLHCHHLPFGPYWDAIRDAPELRLVAVEPDPFVASYAYADRALNPYRYAHHADVIRLDALIRHGGVYADIDTLFVHPFPARLRQHAFVIGREDDVVCDRTGRARPSLCNALLASEPSAPFAVRWRERLYGAFDGSWSNHSGLLPWALSEEFPDEVHVEPPRTFYRHGFRPAGVRALLERLDDDFDGMVSMHLWSHLWWDRRRRDYSHVHAGILTEDYIRAVDTTFTVAARRFLPPPDAARRRAVAATFPGEDLAAPAAAPVSVIIPTYNRSALLAEAIDSVLAQTQRVHEILVVDDGSDDEHRSVLEALARRSPLVRIHALPGHGERSRARDEGLAHATGDYVIFLDDDDVIDADMVASALGAFAADPSVDVVVGCGQWFGDAAPPYAAPLNPFWTNSAADPDGWASALMGASSAVHRELERHAVRVLLRFPIPINAFVARRSAIAGTRFRNDLRQGEDWMFWLDLAAKGCRFRADPNVRVSVRRHQGNARPAASAVAACARAVERVEPLGREERFWAATILARTCWMEGRAGWWHAAARQARHPWLLFTFGRQLLARRVFRLWQRASPVIRAAARLPVTLAPLRSRESDPR
jgi:glycosyltransferase involved in cell wall biosynthesis